MSDNKKSDRLYQEVLETQNEATFKYVAARLSEMREAEIDALIEEAQGFELPEEFEIQIQDLLAAEKRKTIKARRVLHIKKISKVACIVLLSTVLCGTLLITTVDAARYRFQNFLEQVGIESIRLTPNDDASDLPLGVPTDWQNFWYPEYLPEKYFLETTAQRMDTIILVFKNEMNDEIRINQSNAEGVQVYLDNEGSVFEHVVIKSQYEGYWIEDAGCGLLTWLQQDRIFQIEGNISLAEVQKIAENLKFYK